MAKPGDVYLATERLQSLFDGVPHVFLVDASCECLKGEAVRDLLVACGASRTLRSVDVATVFTWQKKQEMRRAAGCEGFTHDNIGNGTQDRDLVGIKDVLEQLPGISQEMAKEKSQLLWESLIDVKDRSGEGVFSGTYSWMFHYQHAHPFDAAFVRDFRFGN